MAGAISSPRTSPGGPGNAKRVGLFLPSNLWVDDPGALAKIDRLEQASRLDGNSAERLRHFVEHGYMTFPIELDPELGDPIADLDRDIDRLWRERPHEVAYAYDSPAKRMSLADPASERRPRYRIHDLHSASDAALALYLDRSIFRHVELIYRQPAVAIQSLYFEFGSQQLLHRDPVVVPTAPASHLIAAWISLEDIHPDCGPLLTVPGSHRLPYYEFSPGQFMFDSARMGAREAEAAMAWDRAQCREQLLEPKPFLGRRGEVLVWHHSLLHGGSEPVDETCTRKSLVVHFSTRAHYHERAITLEEPGQRSAPRSVVHSTRNKVERDGRAGFENPLLGQSEL